MATLPAMSDVDHYIAHVLGNVTPKPAEDLYHSYVLRGAFKLIAPKGSWIDEPYWSLRHDSATGQPFYWHEAEWATTTAFRHSVLKANEYYHTVREDHKLKTMIAPAWFYPKTGRKLVNVAHTRCVHIDYDAQHTGRMPRELFQQLLRTRPLIVRSGTPGSFHAYWVGVDAISLDMHDRLARTLAQHFNADAKIRPNDLLGLPGTINIKNSKMVRIARKRDHTSRLRHRVYEDLANVVDRLDLELMPSRLSTTPAAPSSDSIDTTCLRRVSAPQYRQLARRSRDYLSPEHHNYTDDLSRRNFFIIRLAHELGLTVDQTFMFMTTQLPPHSFKFSGSPDLLLADIANIRSKAA